MFPAPSVLPLRHGLGVSERSTWHTWHTAGPFIVTGNVLSGLRPGRTAQWSLLLAWFLEPVIDCGKTTPGTDKLQHFASLLCKLVAKL